MITNSYQINSTSSNLADQCFLADFGAQQPHIKTDNRCALHPLQVNQCGEVLHQPHAVIINAPQWINAGLGLRHDQEFRQRHKQIVKQCNCHESDENNARVTNSR